MNCSAQPGIEIVTVSPGQVRAAERKIEGCEQCHPDDSELPFDWVIQQVSGSGGMVDFVMAEVARCPNCRKEVSEKTLVERS